MTLPLFPPPVPRTRRRRRNPPPGTVLRVRVGRRTVWLTGPDVQRLLDDAGVTRRQWDHLTSTWAIPVAALDGLLAYAEDTQRRAVTVEAVDR